MRKIVVTGFSGELSRAILSHISMNFKDVKVVGIARNSCSNIDFGDMHIVEYCCDLSRCDKLNNIDSFNSLCEAIRDADLLIHTAAMKSVTDCEENPIQAIKTNIIGTQNVIDASKISGVKQIVNISSDFSVEPVGVYGATKLLQSKLITKAFTESDICSCNIMLGNIFTHSGGTIFHFFNTKYKQTGVLPITDPKMSRFGELDTQIAHIIFELAKKSIGGETFVPKFKSYDILNVAKAISQSAKIEIIGMRIGEKLSLTMLSRDQWQYVIESDSYYVIVPSIEQKGNYISHHAAKNVTPEFSLTSENNPDRFTKEQLKLIIKELGIDCECP